MQFNDLTYFSEKKTDMKILITTENHKSNSKLYRFIYLSNLVSEQRDDYYLLFQSQYRTWHDFHI